jgi:hypothetical protein
MVAPFASLVAQVLSLESMSIQQSKRMKLTNAVTHVLVDRSAAAFRAFCRDKPRIELSPLLDPFTRFDVPQ